MWLHPRSVKNRAAAKPSQSNLWCSSVSLAMVIATTATRQDPPMTKDRLSLSVASLLIYDFPASKRFTLRTASKRLVLSLRYSPLAYWVASETTMYSHVAFTSAPSPT